MPDSRGYRTYWEVLTAAVNDVAEHGYDSQERVDFWAEEIRRAAERSMKSAEEVERMVRDAMMSVFRRAVDLGGVTRINPGVTSFTIDKVRPALHAELSRRTAASLDLIKINRPQAIAKTQQRFRGWATSVPPGGAKVDKTAEKKEIRKALASLPYEERRVVIDQSAKLFSNINTTVAVNGGAIGAIWHSHKNQVGYDGRPTHNARDGKFFIVRGCWAHEAGLVKPNADGYTDQVEQPAEWPFCKCSWQYVFSLRSVPAECLTRKGVEALEEAWRKVRNAAA